MKFSKPLLLRSIMVCVFLGLAACASNQEKSAEKQAKSESKVAATAEPARAGVAALLSSVLPPGPPTLNPYLQNPQKFSEQVEVNFRDAVASMQQKNWAHAESVLTSLAEKNPNLSGVHVNLGIVYRAKGDNEKAVAEFNRAISANPKNVDAYNQLAVLKREAGDFAAAEGLYQKALNVWPFYPDGHKNIAILYDIYLNKPELALPHYQAYQQLLGSPDKQVDSWVADLQRRLNGGKEPKKEQPAESKEAAPKEQPTGNAEAQ